MMRVFIKKIFIDADALVALYDPNDALHNQALKISQGIYTLGAEVMTSYFVLGEAVTVISQNSSIGYALGFLEKILATEMVIFDLDRFVFLQAKAVFANQTSKNFRFSDACNIALINQHNLDAIFSFDKHYKQNGIIMVGIDE